MSSITVTSLLLIIFLRISIILVNCQQTDYDLANLNSRILQFDTDYRQAGVLNRISELRPENIIKWDIQRSSFRFSDLNETKCYRQFGKFQSAARNLEIWALQMIDASSKIPSGILEGNLKDLGSYDECLEVDFQKGNESLRGRHCMYSFSVEMPKTSISLSPTFSICVPDGCDADGVAEIIQKAIELISVSHDTDIDLWLKSVTCSTVEPEPWSANGVITLTLLSLYIFFLVCCTICDLSFRRSPDHSTNKILQGLSKFSLYTNAKRILSMKVPRGNLPALQGIRFFSMGWVVLGHVYYIHSYGVISNQLAAGRWLKSWSSLYVIIAPFTVDTFFVLSGFLITYLFIKEMAKGRGFNIILYYVHRYLRLTPAFAALLLLTIHIFPRIGSGALWEANMIQQREFCSKNWWAALLYIHNYVNTQYLMCLGHTWYLAADMQFFWLSPLVVYPLAKKPKVGLAILSTLLVASILSPAISSAANEYSGGLVQSTNKSKSSDMMRYHYIVSHTRAGPWLMGVFMGYKLAVMKTHTLNSKFVILGWVSAIIAFSFGFFSYRVFQVDGYEYDLAWEIFYAGFARHIWAFGVCWLIYTSVLGYAGIIGKFLALPVFMPLGRISYCIYLVHFIIQLMKVSAARAPAYFSNSTMLYLFCSDFVLAIVFGFLLSLFFESPFMVLEKMLLGRRRGDRNAGSSQFRQNTEPNGIINHGFKHDHGEEGIQKR